MSIPHTKNFDSNSSQLSLQTAAKHPDKQLHMNELLADYGYLLPTSITLSAVFVCLFAFLDPRK